MEYREHAFTVHGREIHFSHAQDIYNRNEKTREIKAKSGRM